MNTLLPAGFELYKGQVIELPKWKGTEDLGYIEVLDCTNPEQVLFKFVLFDSEGNHLVREVWADRETDGRHYLYRVFGWKVYVYNRNLKVNLGDTQWFRKWSVKVVNYHSDTQRYVLLAETVRRGKYECCWIECNRNGLYMDKKHQLPQYLIKGIAKWMDAQPNVIIEA